MLASSSRIRQPRSASEPQKDQFWSDTHFRAIFKPVVQDVNVSREKHDRSLLELDLELEDGPMLDGKNWDKLIVNHSKRPTVTFEETSMFMRVLHPVNRRVVMKGGK
jgi:hypothetical protein